MARDNDITRTGANGRRSSCVKYGGLLYVSGITTVHLEADIKGQAQDIFGQLDKLLGHNGTDKNRILSATVYLRDMCDYGDFNSVWDLWVDDGHEPARSVVQAPMALPEYRLKISLVAAAE